MVKPRGFRSVWRILKRYVNETGKESDVFERFMIKHPFTGKSRIDHITMEMYPSYISSAISRQEIMIS
ncbi:hypothetical protein ACNF40_08570 [Cuniculiplasma sp. SKW4]|uniref:hypothetical protein n=1 Tax=Cuniculiplasma sp. SKW4 TaxID=3400171 RepID=UPI003FD1CD37